LFNLFEELTSNELRLRLLSDESLEEEGDRSSVSSSITKSTVVVLLKWPNHNVFEQT
jgi:hypothetical protein